MTAEGTRPPEDPDREPDREPDGDLIRRSLTEPELFGEVYHRHAAAVHGFATGRVGPQGADDVTAEAFVTAFRIRHRFDPERSSARPWLMGIVVRQIARRSRAERAYYRMLAALPPADAGPADPVTDLVTAQALRRPLARALSGLRAADRDVLLLVAWADLTYEETAEALGTPVGTVRSRLHRARRGVREALAGLDLAGDREPAAGETTARAAGARGAGARADAGRGDVGTRGPDARDRTEVGEPWTS